MPPSLTAPANLRSARPADASTLAKLCIEHADYEQLPIRDADGLAQRLAAALANATLRAWLAEDVKGKAVGYASMTIDFATLGGCHFAHMDCLYLRPAWRGMGLGQQLVEAVRASAREHGCHELQWQTPLWNEKASAFYRRLGATEKEKKRYTLGV